MCEDLGEVVISRTRLGPCAFHQTLLLPLVQVGLEELGPGDGLGSCASNPSPFPFSGLGAALDIYKLTELFMLLTDV